MLKRVLSTLALVLLAGLSYGEGTSAVHPMPMTAAMRWHAFHGTLPFWEVIRSPPQGGGGASVSGTNTWTGTQNFVDTSFFIVDDGDQTKKIAFQASGITTGTTRTLSVPDASMTLAGVNFAQSFSANQIFSNNISLTMGASEGGLIFATAETPDSNFLFTGPTSNAWIIAERADIAFDFAHAAATDPTLFIHSHNQNANEWGSLSADGSVFNVVGGSSAYIGFKPKGTTNRPVGIDVAQLIVHANTKIGWSSNTTDALGSVADTNFNRAAANVAGMDAGDWFQQTAGRSFLASDYTNATTTFSNTALSITVINARKYSFRAELFLTDSVAADGVKIDFNGGAATATTFLAHCNLVSDVGAATAQANATSAALATVINSATLGSTNVHLYDCAGALVPSGAGTFIIRAAQNAHTTGTLTIKAGSWLAFEDNP